MMGFPPPSLRGASPASYPVVDPEQPQSRCWWPLTPWAAAKLQPSGPADRGFLKLLLAVLWPASSGPRGNEKTRTCFRNSLALKSGLTAGLEGNALDDAPVDPALAPIIELGGGRVRVADQVLDLLDGHALR